MIWLSIDIFIVLLVLLMAFIGYKVGLIRTLLNFSSHIISIIFSWVLYPVISKIIMKTSLVRRIDGAIRENISIPNVAEMTSRFSVEQVLSQFKLPHNIVNFLNNAIKNVSGNVYEILTGRIVNIFINIISMLIVYAVCKTLIKVSFSVLEIFSKLPVISQFNRLGGSVFGIMQGAFIVYLIFMFLTIFPMIKKELNFQKQIDSSYIAKEMYYDNLIFKFFLPKYLPKQ